MSVLLIGLFKPSEGLAHGSGRSYCTVQTTMGGIDVTVETDRIHIAQSLGLGALAPTDEELLKAQNRLTQQLIDRVQARSSAGACRVSTSELTLGLRDNERTAKVTLEFACPAGKVTLRNTWRLDVDPKSECVCTIDGSIWVFRLGLEERGVGTPPSRWEVARSFVRLGVEHVIGGIDHVLFLVLLLVAAASVAQNRRFKNRIGAILAVVSGFTLGHSLTLITAGLGWAHLDSRLTESVIALSIIAVGLENILRREVRWRVVTATLMGLIHGFGFASVLAETEIPRRGVIWALIAFNVGIECAQIALVGVLFPILVWGARFRHYRAALVIPVSVAAVGVATIWFIKRSLGGEFWPWLGS